MTVLTSFVISGRFSKDKVITVTTARADLKTELTNGRAAYLVPEVAFIPFRALSLSFFTCVVSAEYAYLHYWTYTTS